VVILLGSLSDERVQVALCDALSDKLELIRVSAAQALGRSGDKRMVDCLLDALVTARSEMFLYTIIEALGELGDPTVIPTIRQYLADPNRNIRSRAEQALDKLEYFRDSAADGNSPDLE
jgi:HEAT repeat protein